MAIVVRFVPKSRDRSVPFAMMASLSSEAAAMTVKPTSAGMAKGFERLSERGVESRPTSLNRLSATLSDADFAEMFGEAAAGGLAEATGARGLEMSSAGPERGVELTVPEALADVIDFAYVPRPVEYHAPPQPIPPIIPHYHLRASDVAVALNAPRCHRLGWTGKGIKVAMTDTGFWPHPYFIRHGYNLVPTESPGSGRADVDDNGHGTGEAANIFVMAPDCMVLGVKHGDSAAGSLEAALAQTPHVVTNSWGWDIDSRTRAAFKANPQQISFAELVDLESVIQQGIDAGVCVVFSAGNGHLSFPGNLPNVISAGGATVAEDGTIEASSYASSFESKLYPGRSVPDFCGIVGRADGPPLTGHILLPVPVGAELDGDNFGAVAVGAGWGVFSGTSAAAPQVAGLIALLRQIKPGLKPDQIKAVLAATATDIVKGTTAHGKKAKVGPDLATGAGLVDALRACAYI